MKVLTASLCILAVLVGISEPLLATIGFSSESALYMLPFEITNWGDLSVSPLAGFDHGFLNYAASTFYTVRDVSELELVPLSALGVSVSLDGTLSFTGTQTDSGQSEPYVDPSLYTNTWLMFDPATNSYSTWSGSLSEAADRAQRWKYELVAVFPRYNNGPDFWSTGTSAGSGSFSGTFSLPPGSGTYFEYTEGARSIAQTLDEYSGRVIFPYYGNPKYFTLFGFTWFDIDSPSSSLPSTFADSRPFLVKAGQTYRFTFPIAFEGSRPPYNVDARLAVYSDVVDGRDYSCVTSYSDMYARNYGTAENRALEYISFVHFDVSAIHDFTFRGFYLPTAYSGTELSWFGHQVSVEMIDSDVAVVSKLQELLDYYAENPPEADDLRGQSERQHALEAAAMDDAENAINDAFLAVFPSSVIPVVGVSIGDSIFSFTTALTSITDAIPWLGLILSFAVVVIILKILFKLG
jgi:hypothetical protein